MTSMTFYETLFQKTGLHNSIGIGFALFFMKSVVWIPFIYTFMCKIVDFFYSFTLETELLNNL